MGTFGQEQCAPPRKGAVWAVTVDSTARAYDISKAALGGFTPEATQSRRAEVYLYLQAETNDVFFYFHSATDTALSDTAAQAATAADLGFVATHCAILEAGSAPLKVRINRAVDKFLVVKAASTAGVLRMWAGSESE
jgi:hypothetical protein